jgi:hypothetical protein
MRKRIGKDSRPSFTTGPKNWLDLAQLATVEVTSEDSSYTIESALIPDSPPGWRAADPGPQTIRLLFDEPLKISGIHLDFHEDQVSRTQEFVLRWLPAGSSSYQEIVRQQFNFSAGGSTHEHEDYFPALVNVAALELRIVPDISKGSAHASLARLLLE